MKITKTNFDGVLLILPDIYKDKRGYFFEAFNERYNFKSAQSNISVSGQAVLRGLHGQRKKPQAKLVTVLDGHIFDVVVNLKTGKWIGNNLVPNEQILIPPGYLHGFFTTTDRVIVEYKCSERYDPKDEIGVIWNDKDLAIDWPVPHPKLSVKDGKLPTWWEVLQTL
jgi:dTDP-4-dehydrorhamnose 3,5-epimerase